MNGKKASKTRILISLFKKYKKPHKRKGLLLVEDENVFVKESPSLFRRIYNLKKGWRKTDILKKKSFPYKNVDKTFYAKNSPTRFVYEIKEDYELSIH